MALMARLFVGRCKALLRHKPKAACGCTPARRLVRVMIEGSEMHLKVEAVLGPTSDAIM